jgi:hypothetical protein
MKTEEPTPETGTAMSLLAGRAEAAKQLLHSAQSKYLPRFKIVHPMEDQLPEYHHKAVLSGDGSVDEVPVPYRLAVLSVRRGVKENYINAEGKESSRIFFADGQSHAKYLESLPKVVKERTCPFKAGVSYLLAVMLPDKVAIAGLDTYGGSQWYWNKVLAKADVTNEGAIVEVLIANHRPNYQPEFKGWDGKKFNSAACIKQHEATPEDVQRIKDAANAAGDGVKYWLER